MSGAGNMLHAIKSLNANRKLLKKRTVRNTNDYKRVIDNAEKPEFKKATPELMRNIKIKIKRYKALDRWINFSAALATFLVLFLVYWVLRN